MEKGSKMEGNGLALNRKNTILSSESEKVSEEDQLVSRGFVRQRRRQRQAGKASQEVKGKASHDRIPALPQVAAGETVLYEPGLRYDTKSLYIHPGNLKVTQCYVHLSSL